MWEESCEISAETVRHGASLKITTFLVMTPCSLLDVICSFLGNSPASEF